MKPYHFMTLVLLILSSCNQNSSTPKSQFTYPETKRVKHVDNYFGTPVSDPYQWLENDQDKEQKQWVQNQKKFTAAFLSKLPFRKDIESRLTQLWNYPKIGIPSEHGQKWFVYENNGLQNQSVLYMMDDLDGNNKKIVIDPNRLSKDGTVAISGVEVSPKGNFIAYATSKAGSDWMQWHVKNLNTGDETKDLLDWVKFSGVSWLKDESGFFYSRFDKPVQGNNLISTNYYQKLYFHKLGDAQVKDRLIYQRKDHKDWGFNGEVSKDGRFLIISVSQGTDSRNRLFVKKLKDTNSPVIELIPYLVADYSYIGNRGDLLFFKTTLHAPNGRVIGININDYEKKSLQEIIPESSDVLQSVAIVNGLFSARYLHNAITRIRLFEMDGTLKSTLNLPGIGSASNLSGKEISDIAFLSFSSYTQPKSIYQYDFETNQLSIYSQPKVNFNTNDYVSKQVFYTSKDGTKVPMILSYKKGLKLDGKTPTLLYGYGGFNIAITPRFSVMNLVWMEQGGIYAVANIRGGSEYGELWHLAGSLHQKQNTFDDFIAAAEYLIGKNYTDHNHLSIYGRSNGGLLIGAVLNQRPDLFVAAIPGVGVMDMLRFQKFTIGWAWTSDYGSSENKEDFKVLYQYSPYHNIKPNLPYPATLILTADHDDRVVPYHSFKYAARLQHLNTSALPTMLRIEHNAGHGAGKPTTKKIEEARDILAFLMKYNGMVFTQPNSVSHH